MIVGIRASWFGRRRGRRRRILRDGAWGLRCSQAKICAGNSFLEEKGFGGIGRDGLLFFGLMGLLYPDIDMNWSRLDLL